MGSEVFRHKREELSPVGQVSGRPFKRVVDRESRSGIVEGNHGSTNVSDPLGVFINGLVSHAIIIVPPTLPLLPWCCLATPRSGDLGHPMDSESR
jgi:hypothetical protein